MTVTLDGHGLSVDEVVRVAQVRERIPQFVRGESVPSDAEPIRELVASAAFGASRLPVDQQAL